MSTQPYPPQPLFTPGVVLGLVIFFLTCGVIAWGKYHIEDLKKANDARVSTIETITNQHNEIEKKKEVQTYRLWQRNASLIVKQKKFSDIPHFFETLKKIRETTHVSLQGFAYSKPVLHTQGVVSFSKSADQVAVETVYTFLNLFRDGFYDTLVSYPLPQLTDSSAKDDSVTQEEYETELPLSPFIKNYGDSDKNTPVYFTLDFVSAFSLETPQKTENETETKSFQFGMNFRLKDIID